MEAVLAKKRIKQSRNPVKVDYGVPNFVKYISKEERLKSFEKWRIPEIQTPLELAEAGFFYSGQEDAVLCFSCGGGLSNWHKCVDPCFEHAKYYPTCAFILEKEGRDFVDKVKKTVKEEYTAEEARLSSFNDFWPFSANKTPKELAKAGLFHTGDSDEVQCFDCGITIMNWQVDDNVWFKHSHSSPVCEFVFNVKGPEFIDKMSRVQLPVKEKLFKEESIRKGKLTFPIDGDYKTLEKRMESFENWPISSIKKPAELAEIGLYYTGEDDFVQCFYCGGLHYAWKVTEDAGEEHARWYPACIFIRQVKGKAFVERIRQKWRNIYGTEEARKTSYKNWPTSATKTPEELSEAGFFSTENEDQAQCFDCGFWHIDWEVYDDPWFIHAKLNPFCKFLRQVKGETFVEKVEQKSSPRQNGRKRSYSSNEPMYKVDDNVINDLMNSSVVRTVLKVGFDESKIKLALGDYLKYHESLKNVKNFFAVIMNSQQEDVEVFACLQNLKIENDRYKDAKLCKICNKQGPILILVPCAHLLSCCSCVAENLEHCFTCNEEIEHKLELFPKEKTLY